MIYFCIIAPIQEEAVFRFMLPSYWDHVYLINIIFALSHLQNFKIASVDAVMRQMVCTFFLGMALSNYNFRWEALALHALYNGLMIGIALGLSRWGPESLIVMGQRSLPARFNYIPCHPLRRAQSNEKLITLGPMARGMTAEAIIPGPSVPSFPLDHYSKLAQIRTNETKV
jgi:hypothetical protein